MNTDENSGLTTEDFEIGDEVRFAFGVDHEELPMFFPPIGTVGIVFSVALESLLVQWPDGTTSQDDLWFVSPELVEKVN